MNISPRVDAVFKEVSNYQDLLLLGDLATITQEKRPYSWISGAPTLSPEAQTALATSLLGLTLKLTGTKLANSKLKLPGGKLRSKSRTEVLAYLALIQVTSGFSCQRFHSFSLRTLWTPWLAARTGRQPPRTPTLTRCTPTSPRSLTTSRRHNSALSVLFRVFFSCPSRICLLCLSYQKPPINCWYSAHMLYVVGLEAARVVVLTANINSKSHLSAA